MSIFHLTMQSSVQIAVPRSRAWEVFADVPRWTQWSRVTLRSDVDEGFGWHIADGLHLKLRMAGAGVPFNVRITESGAARRVAWASTKFTVTAVRTFTFTDDGSGTLVTDHKAFSSPILPIRLFYPRPVIRRMTESFLADLKAECERTT